MKKAVVILSILLISAMTISLLIPSGVIQASAASFLNDTDHLIVFTNSDRKLHIGIEGKKVDPKGFYWESSDSSIADVSPQGSIEGKKPGSCTVQATAKNEQSNKVSCRVTVRKGIKKIQLDQSSRYMMIGEKHQENVTIVPSDATEKTLDYISSNPTVASADLNGKITALKCGRTYIQVKTTDGSGLNAGYWLYVMPKAKESDQHFIAHRGLSAEAPENTLAAFTLAGKAGMYAAECDIYSTKDGRFAITHNRSLKRMTGKKKNVTALTSGALKGYQVTKGNNVSAYPGQTVALLEDYLKICRQYQMMAYIDVKEKMSAKRLTSLLSTVDRAGMSGQTIYISKEKQVLRNLRKISPSLSLWLVQTDASISKQDFQWMKNENIGCNIRCSDLSMKLAFQLWEQGIQISAWDAKTKGDVDMLLKRSVTTVTCDEKLVK